MKKFLWLVVISVVTGCSTYDVSQVTPQTNGSDDHGTLQLADGSRYTGEIKQSMANGYGMIKSQDSTYTGAVSNGKANGFGKTITSDGAIYEGEHVNGEFHGRGKLTLSDGSYFIGNMIRGKVGRGTMYFKDGSRAPVG